jgi:glutathione S-transferase
MKIHDAPGFPNPARIRIVLAEKGMDQDIDFVNVDLFAAEHKQPAFLARNPTGVVPVLELDDLDGNPILTGTTPREKAVIHMMQKRADDQMIDAIGSYFHHATPGLGDTLLAYKSPEWEHRKEWGERQLAKFKDGMRYFNEVLSTQPYIAGDKFSVADITVYCALLHAAFPGVTVPEDCPALAAWQKKIAERPSVKNRSGQ